MIKKLYKTIRYAQFNSSSLRKILSLYYKEGNDYRILSGSLGGIRLHYDRTVGYHEMLGLTETESFKLLTQIMDNYYQLGRASLVICDVGANIGLYSLWFSRHAPASSTVYAFEPTPQTAAKLSENLSLNGIENVRVIEKACSDQVGETSFFLGNDHHTASFDINRVNSDQVKAKELIIQTTTLDYFFYGDTPRSGPDIIKMDIEGGGTVALKGCQQVVDKKRPLFLIESHSLDEDRAISDLILTQDYQAFRLNTGQWVQQKDKTYPHPDGVWGTMLLCPTNSEMVSIIK